MKKNIIAAASLAVAALAALSCSKEADVKDSPAAKGVTIQVVAEEGATKTYVVDGEIPTVEWSGSDYVSVFEVVDGAVNGVAESDFAVVNDGKTSFKTILTWTPADQSFSIQTEDRLFVFTAGETAYTIDGSPRTFPAPVRMRNGNLLIPLYDLDSGTPCGPWTVSWEGTSRTLSIPAVWPAG